MIDRVSSGICPTDDLSQLPFPENQTWACYLGVGNHAIAIAKNLIGKYYIMDPNFGLYCYENEHKFLADLNAVCCGILSTSKRWHENIKFSFFKCSHSLGSRLNTNLKLSSLMQKRMELASPNMVPQKYHTPGDLMQRREAIASRNMAPHMNFTPGGDDGAMDYELDDNLSMINRLDNHSNKSSIISNPVNSNKISKTGIGKFCCFSVKSSRR